MIISPDNYLINSEGKYEFSIGRVRAAWERAEAELKAAGERQDNIFNGAFFLCGIPAAGKSTWLEKNFDPKFIYFDATLTKAKVRKYLIKLAKPLEVKCIVLDTPYEICIERNSKRTDDRKVPQDVMERMSKQFTIPTKNEGFSDVEIIRYVSSSQNL